jgi:hypothetical protein
VDRGCPLRWLGLGTPGGAVVAYLKRRPGLSAWVAKM